jgi:hypothetical protein
MMSQGGRASGTLASALLVAGAVTPAESDRDWSTFHAAFLQTTGITWTSGIGVSRDGDQALLRLAHGCGSLCGRGYVVLVVRSRDGQWRVRYAELQSVS